MIHRKRIILPILFIFFLCMENIFSQHIDSLEFRNQDIEDILLVLAEIGEKSIIPDDTVNGKASYYFSDIEFNTALSLFLSSNQLSVRQEDDIYYISRISISKITDSECISLHTEDTEIYHIIRSLSKEIGQTILFDPLPTDEISIHANELTAEEILTIIIKKYPDYYLEKEESFFYIRKEKNEGRLNSHSGRSEHFQKESELYSANFEHIRFREALTSLFNTAGKEYSLLGRNDSVIEKFNFTGKSFEQILRLLLEQGNSDYQLVNNIFYIIDIERKDVLKKLYTTLHMPLETSTVTDIISLIPPTIGSSQNIKADKNNNSLILCGTLEEIAPIEEFVRMLDQRDRGMVYHRFLLNHLDVSTISSLLPKEFQFSQPVILKESNSFITQLPQGMISEVKEYINKIDVETQGHPVQLRYIKAEELLENPPPSVRKDELISTNNPNIFYFKGSDVRYKELIKDLELLDRPVPQIRYEVLVMQVQEADKLNWEIGLSNSLSDENSENSFLGQMGSLLNLNFDVVSQFGYMFALDLNFTMENSESKVMADTSLNALSGEQTHFQNTETYRYQETEIDPDTGEPSSSGVTREITSGLIVEIEGWASGDGMITMDVKTTISKRDDTSGSGSAIPTTTERSVNTHIRTESGKPVIIGGLMQQDTVIGTRKTPFLGDIPLLGYLFKNEYESIQNTEMVVTIVPYLEYPEYSLSDVERDMESLYREFIR